MGQDNEPTVLQSLFSNVSSYLDTRWDLLLLNVTERSVGVLSGIAAATVAAVFGFMSLLFLGIAGAVWLGQLLDEPALGYLIVAGIFLIILAIVFTIARNYIKQSVFKLVLEQLNNDVSTPRPTEQNPA